LLLRYDFLIEARSLIRESRKAAGLTQAELAARLHTTQSAVARLESSSANPRLETLERALLATGRQLAITAPERKSSVDETLIARNLRLTPAERLAAFQAAYDDVRKLAGAADRNLG
jgi:transcriptional regulator with XRE-family HTH domain